MRKTLLGVDIGTQTIKAVQLSREKNKTTLLSAGYIPSPKLSNAPTEKDEEILSKNLMQLIHDMKISGSDVSLSLPSYKVVTSVIEIPMMNDRDFQSSIEWEAEQYIPLPLSKVKIDYTIIEKDDSSKKMKVVLVAAPITMIEKYMRIAKGAGLNPVSIETEIIAVSRSITHSLPSLNNVLIVTLGATNTDLAVLRNGTIYYSKSYPIGGNTLTRAIAEELNFDANQAEEYKITYGIEKDKLEGKLFKIMEPFFKNLFNEMEKTIAYFKEEYPKEEINDAIITGGASRLKGFMLMTTKSIGINSQVYNPFENIDVNEKVMSILLPDSAIYTTAVGLALKEV